jgi:hypothetical protein
MANLIKIRNGTVVNNQGNRLKDHFTGNGARANSLSN